MAIALRIVGLVAAAALVWGAMLALDNYGQFANVARWTDVKDLGWLRAWLTEFRMPIMCVAGALALTMLSWLWQKLKLGH